LNVVDEKTIREGIVQFPMDESDSFGDTVNGEKINIYNNKYYIGLPILRSRKMKVSIGH